MDCHFQWFVLDVNLPSEAASSAAGVQLPAASAEPSVVRLHILSQILIFQYKSDFLIAFSLKKILERPQIY